MNLRALLAAALIAVAPTVLGGCMAIPPGSSDDGSRTIYLSQAEQILLFRQPKASRADGGYQSLLVGLGERVDRTSGRLDLTQQDIARIRRYAFAYRQGGWQNRLLGIFKRHLGPDLRR